MAQGFLRVEEDYTATHILSAVYGRLGVLLHRFLVERIHFRCIQNAGFTGNIGLLLCLFQDFRRMSMSGNDEGLDLWYETYELHFVIDNISLGTPCKRRCFLNSEAISYPSTQSCKDNARVSGPRQCSIYAAMVITLII